ncbi:hypothetical protein BO94DRAFT_533253 [Aspergillus sclerotioniger CBS 115572]|uniref:Uncharacterized protein n=1 Tax=Aspergillus sclerotioniger CBS 115572 TaxID=1450535 RepID=A0A317X4B9_9EURO|nr:hypothetical protein BO94DRAFT_533253 [Aspergillus sclerotioniger CBS 115572]PWY91798.1 hypothetical protein BO94DRAFT_533253 [Aspergillus sclerotioniger CBS 115572]
MSEQPRRRARTKRVMSRPRLQPSPRTQRPPPNDSTSDGAADPQSNSQSTSGVSRTSSNLSRQKKLHFSRKYWNSLPVIRLTHRALVEFHSRQSELHPKNPNPPDKSNESDEPNEPNESKKLKKPKKESPTPEETLRKTVKCKTIEEFARRGGPDLTELIDVCLLLLRNSRKLTFRQFPQGTSWQKYDPPEPKTASLYDLNVQDHLNRNGVEQSVNRPHNSGNLQHIMNRERKDMENITDRARKKFIKACKRYKRDHERLEIIYQILFGIPDIDLMEVQTAKQRELTNLAPLVPNMTAAKPDVVDGARSDDLDQNIINNLEKFIVPFGISSNTNSNNAEEDMLVVPNFFLCNMLTDDDQSAGSRAALHCGSLGARAMHKIQCYGKNKTYDQMAYSYVAVVLRTRMTLYAVHPIQSQVPGRETDYQMTRIYDFEFKPTLRAFQEGIRAFRNLREHATLWRKWIRPETGNDDDKSGGSGGNRNGNQNTKRDATGNDKSDSRGGDEGGGESSGDNSRGQETSSSDKRRGGSDSHEAESPPTKRRKTKLWFNR